MAVGKEALGVPSRPHGPSRIRKSVGSRVLRAGLALGAIGVGGYEAHQHIPAVRESINSLGAPLADRWNTLQQARADNQFLQERSLGPRQSETTVTWWKELSAEEIKSLATLPDINQIGEKNVSTVSPTLQKKAKQEGYKLIYQADPNDTVGRSVVTKGREIDAAVDWSSEDLGFGKAGLHVRGILKAWVPDPNDPTQKEKTYALLEDPLTKKQFTIAIDLSQFNPNKNTNLELPTFFAVDNLDYGPEYIKEKSKEAAAKGYVGSSGPTTLQGYQVPDPGENRSSKKRPWKGIIDDFPEFYDLLRVKGYDLVDLAQPGDYVSATLKSRGVTLFKDEKNTATAGTFIVRRFGGLKQWQSELHQTP